LINKGKFVFGISCKLAPFVPSRGGRIKPQQSVERENRWKLQNSTETAKRQQNMEFGLDLSISLDVAPTAWYERDQFVGNTRYKLAFTMINQPVFSGTRKKLQTCPLN